MKTKKLNLNLVAEALESAQKLADEKTRLEKEPCDCEKCMCGSDALPMQAENSFEECKNTSDKTMRCWLEFTRPTSYSERWKIRIGTEMSQEIKSERVRKLEKTPYRRTCEFELLSCEGVIKIRTGGRNFRKKKFADDEAVIRYIVKYVNRAGVNIACADVVSCYLSALEKTDALPKEKDGEGAYGHAGKDEKELSGEKVSDVTDTGESPMASKDGEDAYGPADKDEKELQGEEVSDVTDMGEAQDDFCEDVSGCEGKNDSRDAADKRGDADKLVIPLAKLRAFFAELGAEVKFVPETVDQDVEHEEGCLGQGETEDIAADTDGKEPAEFPTELYISKTALEKIQRHIMRVPQLECGGWLIGNVYRDAITGVWIGKVDDVYHGDELGTPANFTFSPQLANEAYSYCRKTYGNGWDNSKHLIGNYHSHADFDAYFSGPDRVMMHTCKSNEFYLVFSPSHKTRAAVFKDEDFDLHDVKIIACDERGLYNRVCIRSNKPVERTLGRRDKTGTGTSRAPSNISVGKRR